VLKRGRPSKNSHGDTGSDRRSNPKCAKGSKVQITTLGNGVPCSQDFSSPVAARGREPGFYTEPVSSPDQTPPPPSAGNAGISAAELIYCLGVDTPDRKTLHLVGNSPLKQKLLRLLDLLGLDKHSVDDFPKQGYTPEQVKDTQGRTHSRAKKLYNEIMEAIDSLFCTDDHALCSRYYRKWPVELSESKTAAELLVENTAHLAIIGHKTIRVVAKALLAASLPYHDARDLVSRNAAKFPDLPKNQTILGTLRFASLRKTHAVLAKGLPLPASTYKYRVPTELLKVAVEFLTSTLSARPGVTRNVKFSNHVFRNMPVYIRGGDPIRENLYKEYGRCQREEGAKAIGKHTFEELTKLLTKKGECKTGLSTYYIKLRYATDQYQKMITRLGASEHYGQLPGCFVPDESELTGTADEKREQHATWMVADDCKYLGERMEEITSFLAYRYSELHLNLDAEESCHSCRFGSNAGALDNHPSSSNCEMCAECMTFFDKTLELLEHCDSIVAHQLLDIEIRKEIESMRKTTPVLQEIVLQYMAHRLRAKVQFAAIKKIRSELSTHNALLVMDHKQKVLPQAYREGQVEYFGKRGMSLLGAMLVRKVIRDDGEACLEYHFFDIAVERYSSQDNMQVLGILTSLLPFIKEQFPGIAEITIQSDNASCLASHDNIPYIHHLNKELALLGLTVAVWIYTEAGTGKGRLDTHFSFVNIVFRSYIEGGDDIRTERQIYEALCHSGGLMGSTAILVDGSQLGVEFVENSDNTQTPKSVCGALLKAFKAKDTGVRETHEFQWKKGETGAYVYTLSGLTKAEHIKHDRLEAAIKRNLSMPILLSHTSSRPPLCIPIGGGIAAATAANANATASDQAMPENGKARALNSALEQAGVEHGTPQPESPNEFSSTTENCATLTNGWARYKNTKKLPPMKLETLKTLKRLYDLGNTVKSKRLSGDRAHAMVMLEVAEDWHEQLIVTIARVKAFFGYGKKRQDKLIREAEGIEEADADTQETLEEIEAVELDEARDLNEGVEENEADEVELEIALERDEAGEALPTDGSE
jgi:hypothetical protein